ncbi:MAG: GNAT family N-acetyltransferase [Sphingopyxis sp.]|nr:GNAT family N-acetyltransferase [Sphingopyxis sp.]
METGEPSAGRCVLRSAEVGDAAAIAAIYAAHVESGSASFDTVPRTVAETEQKISDITAKGWPFLVAVAGEQVVGYAYASQFRDRPAYGFACEDSIYVRSDQVGQGIGSQLLGALLTHATAFGFRQMIAVIGGGEPASVALHGKMGFEHAGRMRSVGRKFGRWLDTVYMQVELGEGNRTAPDKEPDLTG